MSEFQFQAKGVSEDDLPERKAIRRRRALTIVILCALPLLPTLFGDDSPTFHLSLDSPRDGDPTSSPLLLVKGTIDDPQEEFVTLKLDGVAQDPVRVQNGAFETQLQLGRQRVHEVEASSTRAGSKKANVNLLPTIQIDPLPERTSLASVPVRGTVTNTDDKFVWLEVMGPAQQQWRSPAIDVENGVFESEVPLYLVQNQITPSRITALIDDVRSNEAQVIRDPEAPTKVAITLPIDQFETTADGVDVSGTVEGTPVNEVHITVNGEKQQGVARVRNGHFGPLKVQLARGSNTIAASGLPSNTRTVNGVVIEIEFPVDRQQFPLANSRVRVTGNVKYSRSSNIMLKLNQGTELQVTVANGHFESGEIQLDPHDNVIQASLPGFPPFAERHVYVMDAATLTIRRPGNVPFSTKEIDVDGTVQNTDSPTVRLKVVKANGQSEEWDVGIDNGHFTKKGVALEVGKNSIEASLPGARDVVTVTRGERPTITITEPLDNRDVANNITVAGYIEHSRSKTVKISVNGVQFGNEVPVDGKGHFVARDVPLTPDATNTITAEIPDGPSHQVTVKAGHKVVNTNVTDAPKIQIEGAVGQMLPPTSKSFVDIKGTVKSTSGKPITSVTVSAWVSTQTGGREVISNRRQWPPVPVQNGEFHARIDGLSVVGFNHIKASVDWEGKDVSYEVVIDRKSSAPLAMPPPKKPRGGKPN